MTFSKKKTRFVFLLLFVLLLVAVAYFVFMQTPLAKVSLKGTEVHLELGHSPEKSPSHYLDGNAFAVSLSYVDTSSVEKDIVGQYPITIYHGFENYTCMVHVADTEAPVLTCDIKTKTILPGENITIDKLGIRTQDHSELKYIGFTKIQSDSFYTGLSDYEMLTDMYASYREGIDFYSKELQFAYGGIYTLTIEACDTYDNKNSVDLTIIVEEPPVIEAPADFYIAVGSELDYTNYIKAWDFIDDSFSIEDVEIDSSSVSLATAGEYPVCFTATDDYGLSSTATSYVHVLQKDNLQELINTHQINISEHVIVGAYNPYDMGFFDDNSIEATRMAVLPTIVRISNLRDETFGNGFIVKIDDEMVTICTCAHVTDNCVTPKIIFKDGTIRFGSVVGQDQASDVAFICIPIDGNSEKSSLSSDYVKELRTIHIDEAYWKSLADDADITLGYICIDKQGYTRYTAKGSLIKKDVKKDWNSYENVHQMLVDMKAQPGTSGSAIFDETGRLLGMVRGHSKHNDGTVEKVGVPLSEILRQYELIFKKKLSYK